MKYPSLLGALAVAITATTVTSAHAGNANQYFERVATFPVYQNLASNQGDTPADTTSAEISTVSQDGMVVYYSNSPKERVGLINISNPAAPIAAGFVQLDGEPTSVAVNGHFLLVAVNTSTDFVTPSGKLSVYNLQNPLQPVWVKDYDLGGQPDAIAISPDGKYAAIAIENERDEDFDDGLIPQLPAGHLNVLKMTGTLAHWKLSTVDLTGYAGVAPTDPEPEYVSINKWNIAAVSLQENNHIILVNLNTGKVLNDFSAGSTNLYNVDTNENDVIEPIDTILNRRREPDALGWIYDYFVVTANEGDYEDANGIGGGSRGFTVFDPFGKVKYESGSSYEHLFILAGHYPESRSENKGVEPESVIASRYGKQDYLFVGSERGNAVVVYSLKGLKAPEFHQFLPTTIGPEGLLPVPQRNLLIISSEEDDADEGFRSTVSIYQYGAKKPSYPQIISDPKQLIPWGALSGMVGDRHKRNTLYAVPDSYYAQSKIFRIDSKKSPAVIKEAIVLKNSNGETVNYDLEGIAQRADGSFWLVSEGNSGSRPNLLIRAASNGTVEAEIELPAAVVAKQKSNGFEGVSVLGSEDKERVFVAFQREWKDDPAGKVRIGVYTPVSDSWSFLYYPLDTAPEGAWVGLSELSAINEHEFVVIERDNQQGEQAQLKKLYKFSIANLTPAAEGESFPTVEKTLVKDLIPELKATNGWVLDKVEGTAIGADGEVYVVTDNDGVDDSSGETRFMRLGKLFQ